MAVYLVSVPRLSAARPKFAVPSVAELVEANKPVEVPVTKPSVIPDAAPAVEDSGAVVCDPPPVAPQTKRRPKKRRRKKAEVDQAPSVETSQDVDAKAIESPTTVGPQEPVVALEELLQLPRTQVATLLSSCNEPTRKVLLALIYRLASVEDELRGVAAKVRTAGTRALQSATFRAPVQPPVASQDKSGLLEQVFQKNMSLRKGAS